MNGEDFLESMNNIDNELIERSEKKTVKHKNLFVKIGAAAAVLAVVVVVGVLTAVNNVDYSFTTPQGEVLNFKGTNNLLSTGEQKSLDINADFRPLTDEEIQKLGIGLSDSAAAFSRSTGEVMFIEGRYHDSHIYICAGDSDYRDAIIDTGLETVNEISGTEVKTGVFVTDANSKGIKTVIFYAEFVVSGNTVYLELGGDSADAETLGMEFTRQICEIIANGIDLNAIMK